MDQLLALRIAVFTPTQPQGNLFALLPSRPRAYKSELEEEFMSPREHRARKLPH